MKLGIRLRGRFMLFSVQLLVFEKEPPPNGSRFPMLERLLVFERPAWRRKATVAIHPTGAIVANLPGPVSVDALRHAGGDEIFDHAIADIRAQLGWLMSADFLASTPWPWLQQYPRYLRAIPMRLDALRGGGLARDRQHTEEIGWRWQFYLGRAREHERCGSHLLGPLVASTAVGMTLAQKAPAHLRGTPDSQLPRLREIITDNSVVSAQANIAAHFSQRREIYLFPEQADKSDTIVLWLDSPTTHVLSTQFAIGSTAHHLQMRPAVYLASIESLLRNRNFGVVVWEDPWLVFSRGVKGRGEAEPAIRQKLLMLRKTWAISEEEYAAALGSLAYPKL